MARERLSRQRQGGSRGRNLPSKHEKGRAPVDSSCRDAASAPKEHDASYKLTPPSSSWAYWPRPCPRSQAAGAAGPAWRCQHELMTQHWLHTVSDNRRPGGGGRLLGDNVGLGWALTSDPVFRAGCGPGLVCWARMAVVRGREVCLCGQLVSSERGQDWCQPRAWPLKNKPRSPLTPATRPCLSLVPHRALLLPGPVAAVTFTDEETEAQAAQGHKMTG